MRQQRSFHCTYLKRDVDKTFFLTRQGHKCINKHPRSNLREAPHSTVHFVCSVNVALVFFCLDSHPVFVLLFWTWGFLDVCSFRIFDYPTTLFALCASLPRLATSLHWGPHPIQTMTDMAWGGDYWGGHCRLHEANWKLESVLYVPSYINHLTTNVNKMSGWANDLNI